MSENNINTQAALNKGYVVTISGDVLSPKGIILKLNVGKNKYRYFSIRNNKKRVMILVHKLQAFQKFGDTLFMSKFVVRHLNGNSEDNSFSNISIGTQSDNMMDVPEHVRKSKSSNPVYDHLSIINDREKGMSYKELMLKYDISSKGTLSFIINNSLAKTAE